MNTGSWRAIGPFCFKKKQHYVYEKRFINTLENEKAFTTKDNLNHGTGYCAGMQPGVLVSEQLRFGLEWRLVKKARVDLKISSQLK